MKSRASVARLQWKWVVRKVQALARSLRRARAELRRTRERVLRAALVTLRLAILLVVLAPLAALATGRAGLLGVLAGGWVALSSRTTVLRTASRLRLATCRVR